MSLEVGGASRSGLVVPGARKPGPSRRGHVFYNFWTHQKETFLYISWDPASKNNSTPRCPLSIDRTSSDPPQSANGAQVAGTLLFYL